MSRTRSYFRKRRVIKTDLNPENVKWLSINIPDSVIMNNPKISLYQDKCNKKRELNKMRNKLKILIMTTLCTTSLHSMQPGELYSYAWSPATYTTIASNVTNSHRDEDQTTHPNTPLMFEMDDINSVQLMRSSYHEQDYLEGPYPDIHYSEITLPALNVGMENAPLLEFTIPEGCDGYQELYASYIIDYYIREVCPQIDSHFFANFIYNKEIFIKEMYAEIQKDVKSYMSERFEQEFMNNELYTTCPKCYLIIKPNIALYRTYKKN